MGRYRWLARKCFFLVVLVSIVLVAPPVVQGSLQYWIPTFGVSWPNRQIYVLIPSQPGEAREVALRAIAIWNNAQTWFKAAYFPSAAIYKLVIGGENPSVLTDFTNYWSVSNYCPTMPFGVEGCTHLSWDDADNITLALVFLDVGGLTSQTSTHRPVFLALHEFGHALGLPDFPSTSSSQCPFQDLMCLYYPNEYPSTLDLYALHQLAAGIRATHIVLPSYIPYAYYAPTTTRTSAEKESVKTTLGAATQPFDFTLNKGATVPGLSTYISWFLGLAFAVLAIGVLVLFAALRKERRRSAVQSP